MLVQLHWQNYRDLKDTQFVAQGDPRTNEELQAWATALLVSRGDECPDRWLPLVMNEQCDLFVRCAQPAP